jgi:glycosyltransferase involved in cell wall biosynthesis
MSLDRQDSPLDITLATLLPFSLRRFSAPANRLFGKLVAHEELLRQLLCGGAVTGVDVFASSLLERITNHERRECELALDEAFPQSGPRPAFRPLTALPSVIARDDYCFISSGPESQRLGQMRWRADAHRCTITTLIHAVGWADLMPSYLGLVRTSEACDSVVVTSVAAETALGQILDWLRESCGVTLRAPVVRIPLGTDVARADAYNRDASRDVLQISRDELVVLFVGRLTDEYKADLTPLIRLAADLSPSYPSLRVIVAGHNQDNYADRLRRLARSAGVGQHVTCVENPSDTVKHLLYAAADVFVSPSDSVQESFGLTLLEAMSHSLPVVASDWSGYRDIVCDGQTGFLIPTYLDPLAGDAASALAPVDVSYGIPHYLSRHTVVDVDCLCARVRTLLASAELRHAMGNAGRRLVESSFAWPVIVDRYRSLLAEQQRTRRDQREEGCRPLDLGDVFRHYATAVLWSETVIECTDHGRQLLDDLSRQPLTAEGTIMARVLSTACTPTALSKWHGDPEAASREAVTALLKAGGLRVVSPRSRSFHSAVLHLSRNGPPSL